MPARRRPHRPPGALCGALLRERRASMVAVWRRDGRGRRRWHAGRSVAIARRCGARCGSRSRSGRRSGSVRPAVRCVLDRWLQPDRPLAKPLIAGPRAAPFLASGDQRLRHAAVMTPRNRRRKASTPGYSPDVAPAPQAVRGMVRRATLRPWSGCSRASPAAGRAPEPPADAGSRPRPARHAAQLPARARHRRRDAVRWRGGPARSTSHASWSCCDTSGSMDTHSRFLLTFVLALRSGCARRPRSSRSTRA